MQAKNSTFRYVVLVRVPKKRPNPTNAAIQQQQQQNLELLASSEPHSMHSSVHSEHSDVMSVGTTMTSSIGSDRSSTITTPTVEL